MAQCGLPQILQSLVFEDKVPDHSARSIFAHAGNEPIDVTFGIFMAVEASHVIRQAEVVASRTMIARNEALRHVGPA